MDEISKGRRYDLNAEIVGELRMRKFYSLFTLSAFLFTCANVLAAGGDSDGVVTIPVATKTAHEETLSAGEYAVVRDIRIQSLNFSIQ